MDSRQKQIDIPRDGFKNSLGLENVGIYQEF